VGETCAQHLPTLFLDLAIAGGVIPRALDSVIKIKSNRGQQRKAASCESCSKLTLLSNARADIITVFSVWI